MKRAFAILAFLCVLAAGEYFAVSKFAIRHETLNLFDAARQRPVTVDVAVRRDYETKANLGLWKLPLAIISNGNTVKATEYSFLANVLAARGYLVASIQQDLPTDPPLITKIGQPYVGRRGIYIRCEANILFVLGELKKPDFVNRVASPAGMFMADGIRQVAGPEGLKAAMAGGPHAFFEAYDRASQKNKELLQLSKLLKERLAAAAKAAPKP